MTMKIRHIICLVIGAFVIFLAIKGTVQTYDSIKSLDDAVCLESPVVLAENEGKNIIISGRVEMIKGCYDDELGITFNTPVVARGREVEKEDSNEAYCWESTETKYFCGEANLGEFKLSKSMLKLLHKMDDYVDFDKNELAPYRTDKESGRTYLSLGLRERVYYVHCDLEKNSEMTLVGTQKGDSIDVYDASIAVNDGILSLRRLQQENRMSSAFGLFIGYAIAVGLIIYGLSCFIFKKKKIKETADGQKSVKN